MVPEIRRPWFSAWMPSLVFSGRFCQLGRCVHCAQENDKTWSPELHNSDRPSSEEYKIHNKPTTSNKCKSGTFLSRRLCYFYKPLGRRPACTCLVTSSSEFFEFRLKNYKFKSQGEAQDIPAEKIPQNKKSEADSAISVLFEAIMQWQWQTVSKGSM